jgi:hypothetical protein
MISSGRAAGTAKSMVLMLAGLTSALLLWAGSARADTPITFFDAAPTTTQAGGHPDLGITFQVLNRQLLNSEDPCQCQDARDVTIHLPTGFIGNPHATPRCSLADFSADTCPIDSQLGVAKVEAGGFSFLTPVNNMIPAPEQAGLLAFKIILFGTPQFTILGSRTDSDFGLDAKVTSIVHGPFPLSGFQQILWGVPADPSHDGFRVDPEVISGENHTGPTFGGDFCDAEGALSTSDPNTIVKLCHTGGATLPPIASNSPRTPFLQAPTQCDAPLSSTLDVLSYDGGLTQASDAWPQGTGCAQLSFNPSLFAQPTTLQTDAPSGIDVNLQVPQQLSPTIPSPSELRAATVTLPPGFSINSNAADGKTACTDADARFGTVDAAQCPEFSKVGSLEIESSALPGPLPGDVYLGQPLPGNRYRIFLAADGFATHVKLAGIVTPDPQSGQLTISFQDLPQSPLTAFNMHFFGSERGALATPTQCGTYPVTSTFVPWDASLPPQTSTQFFKLDSGPAGSPCPGSSRPFNPEFKAASAGNTAGAHTAFAVDLTRRDGDQNLAGLTVTTPPGFAATLRGIPYCSDSAMAQLSTASYSGLLELAVPACSAASQIGTATAGAGAGSRPVQVPGKVYLAGPFKAAPLSLLLVIPAVSGPYDLGNVAIRAAIHVDPVTAQVTAISDPLPQILEGIPLRARSIRVNLDRPDFALNPTDCDPHSVDATVFGDQGAVSRLSSSHQVANCAALPFGPKLSLRFAGGIKRRGHPAIRAVLKAKPGEANIHRVSVTLPEGELLDNAHIGTVCTRVQFAQKACPQGSLIGHAEVKTPLLDRPLQGSAYLRSSSHELPDIALDLSGQFDIDAAGHVDTVNGRLRTTFETVPDAPVSEIRLDLLGGAKGLVVNSENLCASPKKATIRLQGHNGMRVAAKTAIDSACGSKARPNRHRAVNHARKVR